MTVQDAANWCNQQVGKGMNFDGLYGNQCVDWFNFYYQYLTGASPYSHGYGVPGAKDLWNVPNSRFTKVANNPNDPNQLPPKGSIIIWPGSLAGSGGFGHVAVVDSATATTLTVWQQNWGGRMYVTHDTIKWPATPPIGWMVFNGFSNVPQGGKDMTPNFIKATYKAIAGVDPEQSAIDWHMANSTPESFVAGFWGNNDVLWPKLTQQLADVKQALANEEAKPPREVVKEVEKVVTKEVPVEVTKIEYVHDQQTKEDVSQILTIVKSIKGLVLNLFKKK